MAIKLNEKEEKYAHTVFTVGMILKGANAFLEIVAGLALLVLRRADLNSFLLSLLRNEIGEDPRDAVANYLIHLARSFTLGSKYFAVLFLLSHGIVKIFLVIGLLRNKLWAYPVAIGVFGLFIFYQLYQLTYAFSYGFIALTVLDFFVILLTWHEYMRRKRSLSHNVN